MKDLVHFSHGNGFPSPSYRQLLDNLLPRYDCIYLEKSGHNPQFPVTDNWPFLVAEVLDNIKRQANQPVIAIGHSMGGVLSLLAALEEPSLFKAVIMLDSPLLGYFKSKVVRLAKALGFIDRITPAFQSQGRRSYWQTRDDLVAYLKKRALFQTFSDESLDDYINYGMHQTEKGYELHFDPHIEYLIYRSIPHQLQQYERKLTVPAALIYGDKSKVVDRFDRKYMKKKFGIKSFEIEGSHMFPMESPRLVANEIFRVLDAILKK